MLEPSFSSRVARASSSFGVVNMHLMSCLADRTVNAWSMTCSWYALRCSIQPFLMSLTTQRGSRSTQKQMPPRYWHRCSTARRSRRGPDGPSMSQFDPLGEILLRQRVAEHLVVDAEVVLDDAALGDAGGAAGLEDVGRLVLPIALGTQRRTGPPRSHSSSKRPNNFRSSKPFTSLSGSNLNDLARSSQNGVPVSGLKCQATMSRTWASSFSRA